MQEKEVFEDKLTEIIREINEIKEETVWIRNKIIEAEQMPYNHYNQYSIQMKGGDP